MKPVMLMRLLAALCALAPALGAKESTSSAARPAVASPTTADRRPDVPAKPVKSVAPKYPRELNKLGVRGTVLLRFVVDREGRVQNPEIVKSDHPGFETPALEAIRGWRFSPAIQDGKPVKSFVQLPLVFSPRAR